MRARGVTGRRTAGVAVGLVAAVVIALATTGATKLQAQDSSSSTSSTDSSTSSTDASSTSTEPTTSSTVGGPGGDCGGVTLTKADGTPWVCSFDDEFDGTTLDPVWSALTTAQSGFSSGAECLVDSPNNISVSEGALHLTARREDAPFTCNSPNGDYTTQNTGATVSTNGKWSQTYGRFEARAAFPHVTVPGVQETLWLWPDDPFRYGYWPWSGEIDWAEAYSQYPDRVIPFIHYAYKTPDFDSTNNYCGVENLWEYHTYVVEWTTESIKVTFDGQTCLDDHWDPADPLVKPQPFDQPFMIAFTQFLGQGGNAYDPATTPLPATTKIDYMRVWR